MNADLIYDVGVHDGSDTAYYLSLGYRVFGLEASPVMAALLRARFAAEIKAGRFTLLNVGVAVNDGKQQFWLSENTAWSSFDRALASRNGTAHHAVMVRTRQFQDIVAEYGVPYYCKIDIEGNDSLCLSGLTPETAPMYVSIEMSHPTGGDDLKALRDLGYDSFKIISQKTRSQPTRLLTWLAYALPPKWSTPLRLRIRDHLGTHTVDGWTFPFSSSGPFAEQTPGPWRSYEAAERLWRFLRNVDRRYGRKGLGDWFDIHARRGRGTVR